MDSKKAPYTTSSLSKHKKHTTTTTTTTTLTSTSSINSHAHNTHRTKFYNVLYYKRSPGNNINGINPNRKRRVNQTKIDAILQICEPPNSRVTLFQESNDDDDDDEEEESSSEEEEEEEEHDKGSSSESDDEEDKKRKKKRMSYYQKMKQQQKKKKQQKKVKKKWKSSNKSKSTHNTKKSKTILCSKIDSTIAKKCFSSDDNNTGGSLEEMIDDIIVIAGFTIEIVGLISSSSSTTNTSESTVQTTSRSSLPMMRKKSNISFPSKTTTTTTTTKRLVPLSSSSSSTTIQKSSSMPIKGFTRVPLVSKKRKLIDKILSDNNKTNPTTTTTTTTGQVQQKQNMNNTATLSSSLSTSSLSSSTSKHNSKSIIKRVPLKSSQTTTIKKKPLTSYSSLATSTTNNRSCSSSHLIATNNNKRGNATIPFVLPGAIGNVVIPGSIRKVLKEYQKKGVAFLWNCVTGTSPDLLRISNTISQQQQEENEKEEYSNNNNNKKIFRGCILGDEMGLGKTLMTITLIFALYRKNRSWRYIIVTPSSLVKNWANEFDKWLGKASQPRRIVITKGGSNAETLIKAFVPIKPNAHNSEILILSYDLFRINSSILRNSKQIGLLVIDEGHRLKNSSGSKVLSALNSLEDCRSRVLISGTPIQNNLSEFYNLVNFVNPGILGTLAEYRKEYERPILKLANHTTTTTSSSYHDIKAKAKTQTQKLDQITKTFMLRRYQKDVLKEMLPKRMEVLLFCKPSTLQQNMYTQITGGGFKSGSTTGDGVLSLLTKVRKLCCHPRLLKDERDDWCAPNIDDDDDDEDSTKSGDKVLSLSGKMKILEQLLVSIRTLYPQDKVIIISNFTSSLDMIQHIILDQIHPDWPPSIRLDGTMNQQDRQTAVNTFQKFSTPTKNFLMLLSSKAGGCGLNLVRANRLVMFDPDWNPATDAQAMARIYRTGQTKPCFIYRMFTTGTVEEIILQRQIQKGNLAEMSVDSSKTTKRAKKNGKNNGFSEEELRDCFTLKQLDSHHTCDTKQKLGDRWLDYKGVDDLFDSEIVEDSNDMDKPLIQVAREEGDILNFIHIVNDEEKKDGDKTIVCESDDEEEEEEEEVVYTSEEEFDL